MTVTDDVFLAHAGQFEGVHGFPDAVPPGYILRRKISGEGYDAIPLPDTLDTLGFAHEADLVAHTGDAAIDGGPHGLPALTADGMAWVRQSGALVAVPVATLDGSGHIPSAQLPISAMEYKGIWNANTNSPTLADGTGSAGDLYRVGTAGAQNLGSGSITFDVGDYAIYNGTTWEKSDTTDAVASVSGKTGVVTLVKGDVGLGSVDNTSDANKPVSTAGAAEFVADRVRLSSIEGAAAPFPDVKSLLDTLPRAGAGRWMKVPAGRTVKITSINDARPMPLYSSAHPLTLDTTTGEKTGPATIHIHAPDYIVKWLDGPGGAVVDSSKVETGLPLVCFDSYGADSTGANDSYDACQDAVTVAQADGWRVLGGGIYSLSRGSSSKAGLLIEAGKAPIDIDLQGGEIRLSANVPQALTCNKTGDHQTFTFGWMRNGTINANNVTAGSTHVVAGALPPNGMHGAGRLGAANEFAATQAGVQYRVNFDGWNFENLDIINIPYDPAGVLLRKAFGFEIRQAGAGEATQNYFKNASWNGVRVKGGNHGWRIIGGYDSATAPYNANVLIDTDTLTWDNSGHDTLHVPTAYSPDTCIHVGSLGTCTGDVKIRNFTGRGCGDNCIEVDTGPSNIVNCTAIDCGSVAFISHNFNINGPKYAGSQVAGWTNCEVRVIEGVPTATLPFKGWNDVNQAAGVSVAERVLTRCRYYSEQTTPPLSGQVCDFRYLVGRVSLDVKVSMEKLNAAPAAPTFGNLFMIAPNAASSRCTVDGYVRIRVAGAQTTSNKMTIRGLFLGADTSDVTCDLKIDWAHNISGLQPQSIVVAQIGDSTGLAKVRGKLRVQALEAVGDSDPYGVALASSTNLTLDKLLEIDCDFTKWPAGSTHCIVPGGGQHTTLRVRGQFPSNPFTAVGISAAPTIPASGTSAAYTGFVPGWFVIAGGTVSLVEISDDNSTFRTVAASTPCIIPISPGLYWRITYTVVPSAPRYLTPTSRITA